MHLPCSSTSCASATGCCGSSAAAGESSRATNVSCCTLAARCDFVFAFFAFCVPPEGGEFPFFFPWLDGNADAMPSSSARVSASDAGSRMSAAHYPERSMSSAPGDIRGLVPGFSKETPKHAFSAAAAAAAVAAATSPVSLAGDTGKRFAPLALRRRTIRFAGGLGDGGICKRERHAAR